MNNQQQVIALIKSLSGQANILTIPRVYITLLKGDTNAALLLNQIVYWSDKTGRTDGSFYKSYREWEEETGLTAYQVRRAAGKLQERNIISVKLHRANSAPTLHYRLDIRLLTNLIIEILDNQETQKSRKSIPDYEETQQSDYEETQQSLTETTHRLQQGADKKHPPVEEENHEPEDDPLAPNTPGARIMFARLGLEAQARKRRGPKKFETTAQRDSFLESEAKLSPQELEAAILSALKAGVDSRSRMVSYIHAVAYPKPGNNSGYNRSNGQSTNSGAPIKGL